jgi:hypothetical protein
MKKNAKEFRLDMSRSCGTPWKYLGLTHVVHTYSYSLMCENHCVMHAHMQLQHVSMAAKQTKHTYRIFCLEHLVLGALFVPLLQFCGQLVVDSLELLEVGLQDA